MEGGRTDRIYSLADETEKELHYYTKQNWRCLVKISLVMNVYDQPAYTNHSVRKDIILKLGGG